MKKMLIAASAASLIFVAVPTQSFADNQGHNSSLFGASDLFHMQEELAAMDAQIMKMHAMIQGMMHKMKMMKMMKK